jgi:hypothetical protein
MKMKIRYVVRPTPPAQEEIMVDIKMPPLDQRELVPAGTHIGTLYSVIDLGTQELTFEGKTKQARQLRLTFELPNELTANGRPFVIGRNLTYSSAPRAQLRLLMESWLGQQLTTANAGFNITDRIGCTAVIGVKHREGQNGPYAVLDTLGKPPKGVPERQSLINPPVTFSLDDYDSAVYYDLPQWLQEMIARSPEWLRVSKGAAITDTGATQRMQRMLEESPIETGEPSGAARAAELRQRYAEAEAEPQIPLGDELDDAIPF